MIIGGEASSDRTAGLSLTYSTSKEVSKTIPEWGITNRGTGTKADWTYRLMTVPDHVYNKWEDLVGSTWNGCWYMFDLPSSATSNIGQEVEALYRVAPAFAGSSEFSFSYRQNLRSTRVERTDYGVTCDNHSYTQAWQARQKGSLQLDFGRVRVLDNANN